MINGYSAVPSSDNGLRYGYKSPSRVLARLVSQKYGKVVDVPPSFDQIVNAGNKQN